MNISSYRLTSIPSNQNGAVLIVVLLFLILILLAGVLSVRNSTTDLKLATSDQINTVLLQSSDSVNNKLEQAVNTSTSDARYKTIVESKTSPFGHFLTDDSNKTTDDIIIFCYRPMQDIFYKRKFSAIRRGSTGLLNGTNRELGFCNPGNNTSSNTTGTPTYDYTSKRGTTMTQVMIEGLSKEAYSKDFGQMVLGTDSNSKTAKKMKFNISTTSVLPAFGNAKTDKINECFQKNTYADKEAVLKCMIEEEVASKMVVTQTEVQNSNTSDFCKYFGVDANPSAPDQCSP